MADINVKLKIHETGNGTIEHFLTSVPTNNVSAITFATDIVQWVNNLTSSNKAFGGASGTQLGHFTLGTSRLGLVEVGNVVTDRYKGMMFGHTNASKEFQLTFTIQGTNLGSIAIQFDDLIGNYPTTYTLIVDGVSSTKTNSSTLLEVDGISGNALEVQFVFEDWYMANANVGITYVENQPIEIELDKSWINSFTSQNQLMSDPSSAQTNVLANTGSIELVDKNNYLREKAKMGYLKMNAFNVELYINGNMIQKHIVNENPYYSADRTMSVDLTDKIALLNSIIQPITYNRTFTLYELLVDIMGQAGFDEVSEVKPMLHYPIVVKDDYDMSGSWWIESLLKTIEIDANVNAPFTTSEGTLRQKLEDICQVAHLNFTIDDDYDYKFTSARTIIDFDQSDVIEIPYNFQVTELNYDILVFNDYDGVQITYSPFSVTDNKNILDYGVNELWNGVPYFNPDMEDWESGDWEEILKKELLEDFNNGVRTATIDIFPCDLYSWGGDLIYEWAYGEIIKAGDIVVILDKEGEPLIVSERGNYDGASYWQVVSRTVKYDGQVIISLILREVERWVE